MPQIGFICPPNGNKVSFEECLSGKGCSKEEECCHISFRKKASEQREWKGVPSVTQLQNPTYLSHLAITEDYYAKPTDAIMAIFGTSVHSILEQDMPRLFSKKYGWSGLPDWYQDGNLDDFKVSSWFTKQHTIDKWTQQVNAYRILLEEAGKEVKRMRIQIICRDAKLGWGHEYTKWVEVPFLDDLEVVEYFNYKRDLLLEALSPGGFLPPVCSDEDRWYNAKTKKYTRCELYCDVRDICPHVKNK